MIFCIPASETRQIDSAFEADLNQAINLVVFNDETQEAWDVPVDPASSGAGIPVQFDAVLCGSIRRDVWSHYLRQGIRFFGVEAKTVREAIEKYRKGDITSVRISAYGVEQAGTGTPASTGCGCALHRIGHRALHHEPNSEDLGHRRDADHEFCGNNRRHEHAPCGNNGQHGNCSCG